MPFASAMSQAKKKKKCWIITLLFQADNSGTSTKDCEVNLAYILAQKTRKGRGNGTSNLGCNNMEHLNQNPPIIVHHLAPFKPQNTLQLL